MKKSILFVIPSLRMGGAEHVGVLLCEEWQRLGRSVKLLTFDTPEHDFYTPPCARVSVSLYTSEGLTFWQRVLFNFQRLKKVRQEIQRFQPDCVVSFLDAANLSVLLSTRFLKKKPVIVIAERTYPPFYPHSLFYKKIRQWAYGFCTHFVAQTQKTAQWAAEFLSSDRIHVIPNPLKDSFLPVSAVSSKMILAVGRLSKEKGFDLLIRACELVFQKHPDWSLEIVGEGDQRQSLQQQIDAAALCQHVFLKGATSSPYDYYQHASLFVLSSRVEGFPNAMLEAMASRLAIVSFDCCAGPSDLIAHDYSGMLVPPEDEKALADAIIKLIEDPLLRESLAQHAYEQSQQYGRKEVAQRWLELF